MVSSTSINKFHINKSGNPMPCSATVKCPFGDLVTDHYSSFQEAVKIAEQKAKLANSGKTFKTVSKDLNEDGKTSKKYLNKNPFFHGETWKEVFENIVEDYEKTLEFKDQDAKKLFKENELSGLNSSGYPEIGYESIGKIFPNKFTYDIDVQDAEWSDTLLSELNLEKFSGQISHEDTTDYYDEYPSVKISIDLSGTEYEKILKNQEIEKGLNQAYRFIKNPELPNWGGLALIERPYFPAVKETDENGKIVLSNFETHRLDNKIKSIQDKINNSGKRKVEAEKKVKALENEIKDLESALEKIDNEKLKLAGRTILETSKKSLKNAESVVEKNRKNIDGLNDLTEEVEKYKKERAEAMKILEDDLRRNFLDHLTKSYPSSDQLLSRRKAVEWLETHPDSYKENWI